MPSTSRPRRCWKLRTARSTSWSKRSGASEAKGRSPVAIKRSRTATTAGPALPTRSNGVPVISTSGVPVEGRSADVLGQLPHDDWLGPGTGDRLDQLALDVDVERRQAGDAVPGRDGRVLVGVDLDDVDLVGVLAGQLVQDRRHGLARLAPGRPEVDHDRLVAGEDVGVEAVVGDAAGGAHGAAPCGIGRPVGRGTGTCVPVAPGCGAAALIPVRVRGLGVPGLGQALRRVCRRPQTATSSRTGTGSSARAARYRSASRAATHPEPAAVMACMYSWSTTSPQAKTPGSDVRELRPSTSTNPCSVSRTWSANSSVRGS